MSAPVLAVGAIIRDAAGRVVIVRRGRAPSKGMWTLPGGKIEPGESPAQATVREVKEETGLDVRVVAFVTVFELRRDGYAYDIHEHLCEPVDARPLIAGDDADDARWAPPAALAALGVHEDAIAIVRLALDRDRTPV
jgi:mutator protein MutT